MMQLLAVDHHPHLYPMSGGATIPPGQAHRPAPSRGASRSPPRHPPSPCSKLSKAEACHKRYLDSLEVPSLEKIASIAQVQERKEEEVGKKYEGLDEEAQEGTMNVAEREKAAGTIQRTYRGHRTRRQMQGLSLDPSTRWIEAIREARYRNLTQPRPKSSRDPGEPQSSPDDQSRRSTDARRYWNHVSSVARHAHGENPDDESVSTVSSESHQSQDPYHKAMRAHHRRQERKEKEAWKGKMMDLPYFLEMVDVKHRYGSNLRTYHAEWKKADTHENFFYWLDYGEGKNVEVPTRSRDRLEREQVRYLSREERMQYLVDVDDEGKLRWRKNGELIDTTEEFRDSVVGIVKQDDEAKTFRQDEIAELDRKAAANDASKPQPQPTSSGSSDNDEISSSSSGPERYPDPSELRDAKGPKKIVHVTPAAILNRLMRKSVKKNTWIFTADTSMNLYVGIKQSGSFQHSSFMHGSRISAAGLIKVKRGQLRSLSPLSGHYRPPTSAFRHFIGHLKEENVDMSRVSVSKSYAVLVGLETYMGGKERVKKVGEGIKGGAEWVIHPDEARAKREREKDKSKSAQLAEAKQREREEQSGLFGRRLKDVGTRVGDKWADKEVSRKTASRPGSSGSALVRETADSNAANAANGELESQTELSDRTKGEVPS